MNKELALAMLTTAALQLYAPAGAIAQEQGRGHQQRKETTELLPWETDTLLRPIPINRQAFTDKVSQQVRISDLKDGAVDQYIDLPDTAAGQMLTKVLLQEVPAMVILIENLPDAAHQTKLGYHRALQNLMRRLNSRSFTSGDLSYFKKSVTNFREMILAREQNNLDEFVKENANIYSLDNGELLDEFPKEKAYVFEAVGTAYPEMMIKRLPEYARESYADPIIAAAARVVPGTILTYATSTSYLSAAVRRNKDPLVQSIVKIASESKSPLKVLPFLGEINSKQKTVAEVDAIADNPVAYYKAMVALKTQNESVGSSYIDKEISYRGLQFVRVVNELHDSPAPVRFKSLAPFNAEDLYFMMIGSQDEIYTSSFTWMFHRMMEQMKPLPGDQFLDKLHKSHFRTFIRMCAGYNTLATFLASMESNNKEHLMKEFVANLEQGDANDLEDAVDVADAFGSLTDAKLIDFLKAEIKNNYERTYKAQNKESAKGVIVYGLLSTIFNSAENTEGLSNNLNSLIPPITYVPNAQLKDKDGSIVQQVFFYGDKDGMGAFTNYINLFRNNKWTITSNKYWTTIKSIGSHPVVIYANIPLPEDAEENDEYAQKQLQAYIDENEIHPSVIIHRGHSYYLPTTLSHLTSSAKIVVLGSCGGYHNLSTVLNASPDAHIISSKQIGALRINVPIITSINDYLLAGKDVDWLDMWKNLSRYFAAKGAGERDLFSDYVPPNKNLGAIFIKAYRKMAAEIE